MSTSERTFSQVKAILGKLDRSIDEARERRTQRPGAPAVAAPIVPAAAPVRENGAPHATPSQFGRAQPMPARPSSGAPQARPIVVGDPTARWGT